MKLLSLIVALSALVVGCETVEVSQEDIELVRSGKKVLLETGNVNSIVTFMLLMPSVSINSVDGQKVQSNPFSTQQVSVYPGSRRVTLSCHLAYTYKEKEVDINYEETITLNALSGYKYQITGAANIDENTCNFKVDEVPFTLAAN